MSSTSTQEKHVLIFSAKWCGPCRQMRSTVWSNENVKKVLATYNSVQYLDIDDQTGQNLAAIYRIFGVPSIVIVDQDGKPLKSAGFMGASEAVSFFK